MKHQKYNRRSIRLNDYDYSQAGAYFITICTQNRDCLFGNIVNGEMVLNDAGKMAQKIWEGLADYYRRVKLDAWVIMPNHVHGIINIVGADSISAHDSVTPRDSENWAEMDSAHTDSAHTDSVHTDFVSPRDSITPRDSVTPRDSENWAEMDSAHTDSAHTDFVHTDFVPALGTIVQSFKRHSTIEYIKLVKKGVLPSFHKRIWQRNYYEHIIRNKNDYDRIYKYIENNPVKWELDSFHQKNVGADSISAHDSVTPRDSVTPHDSVTPRDWAEMDFAHTDFVSPRDWAEMDSAHTDFAHTDFVSPRDWAEMDSAPTDSTHTDFVHTDFAHVDSVRTDFAYNRRSNGIINIVGADSISALGLWIQIGCFLSMLWWGGVQANPTVTWSLLATLDETSASVPAPIQAVQGTTRTIAGYMVPLNEDFMAETVAEFFLVPDPIACIHGPPPPINQVVYVEMTEPVPIDYDFRGVRVTGTFVIPDRDPVHGFMGYELVGHTATPANFEAREPIRVHELPQTDQLLPDY
jgi:REP element-mobilizing transposase RayT